MVNVPVGLGDFGAPTAVRYTFTTRPSSINASLRSGTLTTILRVDCLSEARASIAASIVTAARFIHLRSLHRIVLLLSLAETARGRPNDNQQKTNRLRKRRRRASRVRRETPCQRGDGALKPALSRKAAATSLARRCSPSTWWFSRRMVSSENLPESSASAFFTSGSSNSPERTTRAA